MELEQDPHGPSKGMSAIDAQRLMAIAIAQQTGKPVEEVLAFLGAQAMAVPATLTTPQEQTQASLPLPIASVVSVIPVAQRPAEEDGFIVTEEYDEENAPIDLINKIEAQENTQDWSGTIREGSNVKVTYHRDQGVKGRLQWVGKIGTVVRKLGNENATIYEVEFVAGKIPETRRNPKTGKLQKGFKMKKLQGTFDDTEIELA